jgi:hypothetical protein
LALIDTTSYEAWTKALRDHFFVETNSGIPVTFFVDPDVLAELSGLDPSGAEARLATVVRPRLLPEASGDVFSRVVDDSWSWRLKHPERDPPFLPVLAVAVLAAAHMARTQDWAAHNYYRPLREILRLPGSTGMPAGYDAAMQSLWGHLTWWLNDYKDGAVGLSSVPAHPSPPYIGYALSQALFRSSDRQRLTHFFLALDLAPREPIEAAELLTYFRAWSQRSHLSSGAREMARRDEYREVLAGILTAEWNRWDGSLRDERGRRLGRIFITLDLYLRPRLAFVAECPRGFPAQATFDFDENRGRIGLKAASNDFYGELPLEVSADALDTGLRGQYEGFAVGLTPSPVVPFRQHEALGCWASVRQLVPGEQHWVLVRDDHAPMVRDYLREAALAGWREARAVAPGGWIFIRDVVIDAAPHHVPNPALSRVVPSTRARPSLWGGLPVASNPDLYLSGGEPDLWVPTTQVGETLPLAIDGQLISTDFGGGRVALSGRGLAPGEHAVTVGPSRLRFQTAETIGVVNSRSSGALSHQLRLMDGSYVASSARGASETASNTSAGTVQVVGISLLGATAVLPTRARAPLLLPAKAGQYIVLGVVAGEFVRPQVPPEIPRWVRTIAPFSAGREFQPPFDVAWVLVAWRTGEWEARLRSDLEPRPCDPDTTKASSVHEWCRCFLELEPQMPPEALKLWSRYRAFAEKLSL